MVTEEFKRLSWGTQAVDWQERINIDRMRKERAERTRAKMKKHGVVAAFLTGDNQRYAASIPGPLYAGGPPSNGSGALVFAEYPGDTIVYGHGEVVAQHRVHCTWIKPENLRYANLAFAATGREAVAREAKKQAKRIKQDIEEKGLSQEKVAVDAVIPPLAAALANGGLHIVSADEIMIEARKIKTADEINCMKMSGAICDRAWWAIYEHLRPGISECELASYAMAEIMKMQNLSLFIISLRSGPNLCPNFISHSPTDRIIQAGDLVYCDFIGPVYSGYRVCYYRTFKVGTKPTPEEKDWFKKSHDWLYKSMETIRAGITTADVAKVWPTCDEWGCTDEADRQVTVVGHGIGLSQHEYPYVNRNVSLDFPQPIEVGNVVALETQCGRDFIGGCRTENVVAVTEKGCENLYRWPDDEIIVPRHSLLID